jgi:hypothetical protein
MSEASNAASAVSLTLALNLDTGQRVRRSSHPEPRDQRISVALFWTVPFVACLLLCPSVINV